MARVLLHSLLFPPDGVSTAYLMSELAIELRDLGHAVTVLTTTPHYNLDTRALARQPLARRWLGILYYSELEGIPVWHVKVPMKGTRVWGRAVDYVRFHLVSLLLGLGGGLGPQDIVIATSPPLTIGVVAWLLATRWRAPAVYKVAEIYPDLAIQQGVIRHPAAIAVMKWVERFVYARNVMMVPIADQFHSALRERGVPDKKLCMIPDWVDTDRYTPLPRRNPFSEAHRLVDDFVVLYGGNIGLVQDWESVLYAAGALSNLPITFAIVGNGNRREWLAAEVTERRLTNVRLFGYQPRELMPEILASCDVSLIPMTRIGARGGFPSKIYTIMACAKPVIASAAPDSGMAKMIAAAGCGRVVDPEDPQGLADTVLQAYRERQKLPEEGARGRRFVEDGFSRRAVAHRYDALIRDLISS